MEMHIKCNRFTHIVTVTSERVGVRYVGRKREGFKVIERGIEVPVYHAYCDQMSLIYTEGDTESIAIERMRLAVKATYDSLSRA